MCDLQMTYKRQINDFCQRKMWNFMGNNKRHQLNYELQLHMGIHVFLIEVNNIMNI
jgi:hypothetical protein